MHEPTPNAADIRARLAAHPRQVQRRSGYRRAAVLFGLYPQDGEWRVLLTRRTSDLPHHRGQIAFPGGSVDDGEDCVTAALREAQEEIDLDPSRVDILGCHDDIWTPTGFVISPVVGVIADTRGLYPNPQEVSRIFSVPLAFFGREENIEVQSILHEGVERTVYFHRYDGETIWGATALMIRNFLLFLGMLPDGGNVQSEA